ncbi:MAG TPA: CerR family C-terminal domain-containing protein [Victivallales bacterium]|nr:CerR family C-terminal domain-containing protein [Victivallales bacterium]
MNANKKGDSETRRKLLITSADLFGKFGFDGVSVRKIASETKVNLSAIGYHFGTKEELYRASIEYLIKNALLELTPIMKKIDIAEKRDNNDKQLWKNLLSDFLEKIIRIFCSDEQKIRFMLYIREKLNPHEKTDIFSDELIKPIKNHMTLLIRKNTSVEITSKQLHFKLFSVIGQLYLLLISKNIVLAGLGYAEVTDEFIMMLKENYIKDICSISHII